MPSEVESVLARAAEWAASRPDVAGVALVGSQARGEPRSDSDVDLVVLTETPSAYVEHDEWVDDLAPGATPVATRDWGAVTERRLRLPSGLEVEVGIGLPSWADVDPVDPGTARVAADGFRTVYDPRGLLAGLKSAVAGTPS